MSVQETLLSALASYGVAAIFVSVLVSAMGLPLPTSFLLIVAGSFVESGDLSFWPVIGAALAGAVIGDHLGYGVGWFGGTRLARRIAARPSAQALLTKAEMTSKKWGGLSVFISRWLLTAIGPYVNLSSGITRFSRSQFAVWVLLGEAIWVVAYVYLGRLFSDRVSEISDILGDFSYVVLGLMVVGVLGYLLIKNLRKP